MKTFVATPDTVTHNWYVVDAEGQVLGRLASEIAKRLRGKHKPEYTPHIDTGDYIVVVNATKVRVTGNKAHAKVYYSHSGYPGGLKEACFQELLAKAPHRVIERAVKGMLPKGPLGRAMYRKLKVFTGATHSHSAQQPQVLRLT
ncbi:MAG: 50S ribosomal protein L13 [Pseudomonadota bacterium]|nr:50S ribosomal protein L13 [Pseudomonadota bacterium]